MLGWVAFRLVVCYLPAVLRDLLHMVSLHSHDGVGVINVQDFACWPATLRDLVATHECSKKTGPTRLALLDGQFCLE